MKKIVIILIVLVLLIGVAWYLISPIFNVVEVDEESPLVMDMFDGMNTEQKEEFDEAVDKVKGEIMEMTDLMPSNVMLLSRGEFKERAHEVMGQALLIENNGKKIIRFENFETINGPNLHIYLSSELGDSDFIDLGEIKATKGNVNYEIPDDVDLDRYNKILVWCVPFRVLFSYAELE